MRPPTRTLRRLLLTLALVTPAWATGAPPAVSTYTNSDLHFTWQYPASFHTSPELSARLNGAFTTGSKDEPEEQRALLRKCLTIPLSASRSEGGDSAGGLLMLLRLDYRCMGQGTLPVSLDTFSETMMVVLEPFGNPILGNRVNYRLDGHDAAFTQASVPARMIGPNVMLHAGSVCTLIADNAVCWLIMDSDYKAMPALVSAPVAFNGHPGVPLIDKDMVPGGNSY